MPAERSTCVFLGTNVRSGTARCLVVRTGAATQFGTIAHRLTLRPPEAEFDRGIRRFGYLLTSAMLVMVLLVFVAHVFRGRPPIETLLFSVALAVGLSPELLPAILTVNLARGAQAMALRGVLVRRLGAIENLGSMDVLCTDKTGTLTEGVVALEGAYDASGARSAEVLELAVCNAELETGVSTRSTKRSCGSAPPISPQYASSARFRSTSFASASAWCSTDREAFASSPRAPSGTCSPLVRGSPAVRRWTPNARGRWTRSSTRGAPGESGCWRSQRGRWR
jgi:magnesium-transporting ATPase (P-type)